VDVLDFAFFARPFLSHGCPGLTLAASTGSSIGSLVYDAVHNESESSTSDAPEAKPLDTPASAGEKIRQGSKPAAGVSGAKGEREREGGRAGADEAFDGVNGANEVSPREGVRVKDLDGGVIEVHDSTKSRDYPVGTPTVKVQTNGKPTTTVRFPKETGE
jgi:hypothetical protein